MQVCRHIKPWTTDHTAAIESSCPWRSLAWDAVNLAQTWRDSCSHQGQSQSCLSLLHSPAGTKEFRINDCNQIQRTSSQYVHVMSNKACEYVVVPLQQRASSFYIDTGNIIQHLCSFNLLLYQAVEAGTLDDHAVASSCIIFFAFSSGLKFSWLQSSCHVSRMDRR